METLGALVTSTSQQRYLLLVPSVPLQMKKQKRFLVLRTQIDKSTTTLVKGSVLISLFYQTRLGSKPDLSRVNGKKMASILREKTH